MSLSRRRHPFDVYRNGGLIVVFWRAAALKGHIRWDADRSNPLGLIDGPARLVHTAIRELLECIAGDRAEVSLSAGVLEGGAVVVQRKDCRELLANLQAAVCEFEHERAGASC